MVGVISQCEGAEATTWQRKLLTADTVRWHFVTLLNKEQGWSRLRKKTDDFTLQKHFIFPPNTPNSGKVATNCTYAFSFSALFFKSPIKCCIKLDISQNVCSERCEQTKATEVRRKHFALCRAFKRLFFKSTTQEQKTKCLERKVAAAERPSDIQNQVNTSSAKGKEVQTLTLTFDSVKNIRHSQVWDCYASRYRRNIGRRRCLRRAGSRTVCYQHHHCMCSSSR